MAEIFNFASETLIGKLGVSATEGFYSCFMYRLFLVLLFYVKPLDLTVESV